MSVPKLGLGNEKQKHNLLRKRSFLSKCVPKLELGNEERE